MRRPDLSALESSPVSGVARSRGDGAPRRVSPAVRGFGLTIVGQRPTWEAMTTDAALAPRPRSDIARARLGADTLLYEPVARRLHTLNTSAALVWRRLDGLTTLWDIAGSLAEIFAADRAVIEGDVAAVVDRFDELGLLSHDLEDPPAALPSVADDDARAAVLLARLDAHAWPSASTTYRAVGFAFRVRSEDPQVAEELERVLRPLACGDDHAAHVYSVRNRVHDDVPQWRVYFDGVPLGTVTSADAATALLLWHVNQAVVDHTAGVLFFHGGAVQVGERVVVLPAEADSGTSTLIAALVRRGLSYLTDEAVALDVAVGRVLPFPKSICLDADPRGVFPELFPGPVSDRAARGRWHLDPARIPDATVGTGGRVALVVSPRRADGAPTRLERAADVDALRLLLDHTFPFDMLGPRGFHALVAVAQQASVYELEYSDPESACDVVLQLVREIR